MIEDGRVHVNNIMHAFIEGLAAGVYQSLDDVQRDALEYLNLEKAVVKLSNWKNSKDSLDSLDSLAYIFDGLSKSKKRKEEENKCRQEWEDINTMPKLIKED